MPCLQHTQGDKNWQLVMQERDPKLVALQQAFSQFLFSLRTTKHLCMLEFLCALIIEKASILFHFATQGSPFPHHGTSICHESEVTNTLPVSSGNGPLPQV